MPTLYFKQGSSDKIYQADLVAEGDKFNVVFAYGRRGSTLATGTKNTAPLNETEAQKVLNQLLKAKMGKGYTEGEEGTVYLNSGKEYTGIHCQLLNPIEESEIEEYITKHLWVAQEKYDGKRIILSRDETVTATNRKGLATGIPETIAEAMALNPKGTVIDGEAVGDVFYAFDCLKFDGKDITHLPYAQRVMHLRGTVFGDYIKSAPVVTTTKEKRELYEKLRAENREGIVFKDSTAPYTAGRPNSGGTQRKFKFCAEATLQVLSIHPAKRSFAVGTTDGRNVGNVTVPANKEIPKVGDLTEIRYLYAYEGGSLYQPFYKELRTDKTVADTYKSLKFKAE